MSIKQVNSLAGAFKIDYDSTNGMRAYKCLYNSHSASRAANLACFYDQTATSLFGMQVKQAATANLNQCAGVHVDTVTTGAWGWVQIEGYNTGVQALVRGTSTSTNAAAMEILKGVNAVDYLTYDAAAAAAGTYHNYIMRLESATVNTDATATTTTTKCYIKCF